MQLKKEIEHLKKSIETELEKAGLSSKIKAGLLGAGSLFSTPVNNQTEMPEIPKKEPVVQEQKKQNTSNLLQPGEILKDYHDPRHIATEEFYENKYGLPKRHITAIRVAGEMSHWDQASNLKTKTTYQFTPTTRNLFIKKYDIDPWKDTDSSIHATALHLKEGMKWAKQKFKIKNQHDLAVISAKHFHAGPNVSNWGDINKNYGFRISKGLKILQSNPQIEHLDDHFKQPHTVAEKSIQEELDSLKKSIKDLKNKLI